MKTRRFFKSLGLCMAFIGFLWSPAYATSTENYSRWLTRLGMELDYARHSANGMWMHGVMTTWVLETAYIKKQVKIAADAQFGWGPMDLHSSYNTYGNFSTDVNIFKNEERFNRWQGAISALLDVALKVGWNLTDSIEDPLYINVGYVLLNQFVHHSRGNPFTYIPSDGGILIEVEGKKMLNDKFSFTYLGRITAAGALTLLGLDEDSMQDAGKNHTLKNTKDWGFELRANAGITYAIGKRMNFFARLNAKYKYLPATGPIQLTTLANNYGANDPLDTGILGNTTFNIAYPKNYTFFGGLTFGFEF